MTEQQNHVYAVTRTTEYRCKTSQLYGLFTSVAKAKKSLTDKILEEVDGSCINHSDRVRKWLKNKNTELSFECDDVTYEYSITEEEVQ